MGKKGGGGSSDTEYVQSPEARQVMQMFMPTIQRIANAGSGGSAQAGYNPGVSGGGGGGGKLGGAIGDTMGMLPGAALPGGPLSVGTSLWDVGGYDVPDMYDVPDFTLSGLPSDVKTSFMAPYKEAESQLMETLGGGGGLGSARGGFSGQGAAGLGRFWADAAPEYTKSLMGAAMPMWQADLQRGQLGYGSELGRSKDIWQQELLERQFPFSVIPSMMGESMPSPVVSQGGGKK